jgi:hypothetical protein
MVELDKLVVPDPEVFKFSMLAVIGEGLPFSLFPIRKRTVPPCTGARDALVLA